MPNDFYTPTGNPTDNSAIVSTDMRAEFAAIVAGFNKMPSLTGNANKLVVINSSGTGMDVTVAPAGLTSVNKIALTQPANGATLTILDGKTLTVNHSLTLAGTDGTTMTFPAASASVARIDAAQTFAGTQTFGGLILANLGLTVAGAAFNSRGITDNATAKALTLSGSGANSVTIANSATNPTIGTSAGSLIIAPATGFLQLNGATVAGLLLNAATGSSALTAFYVNGAEVGRISAAAANSVNIGTGSTATQQVSITHTASADRYITLTGSNGGNPTIGTSAGYLNYSATVLFSGPTAPLATTTGIYANATAVGFVDSTRTADNRQFDLTFSAGAIKFRALNDAYTQAANAIAILGGYGAGITGINLYTSAAGAAGTIQVAVTHTAAANRYITLTGSNGGNPTIGTSGGNLVIAPAGLRAASIESPALTVNYLSISGATSGSAVVMRPNSDVDTNIGLTLDSKGSGQITFRTDPYGVPAIQAAVTHTASADRYITLTGSNGGNPTIGTSAGDLAIASATGYLRNTASVSSIIYSIGTTGSGAFVASGAAGQAAAFQMLIDGAETARVVSSSNGMGLSTGPSATVQVSIAHTASANRYITLTGSNGGNPTIGTSGGNLILNPSSGVVGLSAGSVSVTSNLQINCTGTQGAGIQITGNGATTPSKFLKVVGGNFEIVNDAYSASVLRVTDAGVVNPVLNVALTAGGVQAIGLGTSVTMGVYFGSGAPTVSAAKGSLYLRSDGSATNNRMYVNTDGATTWTAVTTAA